MNHLPNETAIPVLLFLLNCPVADSDVKDKKKKKQKGGKCTLNIWIYSELLSLSSIHHVPHRTGTAQRVHLFLQGGQISVSSVACAPKTSWNSPSELSTDDTSLLRETCFLLSFSVVWNQHRQLPPRALTVANGNKVILLKFLENLGENGVLV